MSTINQAESISIKELPLFYSENLESYVGYIDYFPGAGQITGVSRALFSVITYFNISSEYAQKLKEATDPKQIEEIKAEEKRLLDCSEAHFYRGARSVVPFLGAFLLYQYDGNLAGKEGYITFDLKA